MNVHSIAELSDQLLGWSKRLPRNFDLILDGTEGASMRRVRQRIEEAALATAQDRHLIMLDYAAGVPRRIIPNGTRMCVPKTIPGGI